MANLNRSNFQAHPFHLVSPSPWPLYTSLSLFSLTTSAVLSFHGFAYAQNNLFLSLFAVILAMSFWFRDIIAEGRAESFLLDPFNLYNTLKTARVITPKQVEQSLVDYYANGYIKAGKLYNDDKEIGYYLAGLLEGDGHISLPSLGVTTLSRVLNPRIVFTSHINNLGLYAHIQSKLGGIGRFQLSGGNVIRYIIGDMKGITVLVNLVSGKLRTPKNQRLNNLILFINQKYSLNIPYSNLDLSNMDSNCWFSGFTEADGHFGVKLVESKPKSDERRSVCANISLKFRLDQRSYDKPNKASMSPIMHAIASFLSSVVKPYLVKPSLSEVLSVSVQSINKIGFLVDYFNNYPLRGAKAKDFYCWEEVYNLILTKEHLTEQGRLKIRAIDDAMKNKKK